METLGDGAILFILYFKTESHIKKLFIICPCDLRETVLRNKGWSQIGYIQFLHLTFRSSVTLARPVCRKYMYTYMYMLTVPTVKMYKGIEAIKKYVSGIFWGFL